MRLFHLSLIGILSGALFAAPETFAENFDAPTVTPVGPGVISGPANEFGASRSPKGDKIYYTLSDSAYTHMTIMVSNRKGDRWSEPTVATFSGKWNDADPSFSPDGKRIYFISNRPVKGDAANGHLEIWYVEKQQDGAWGPAKTIEAVVAVEGHKSYPSIAADGSIYFGHKGTVFVSNMNNGQHQPAVKLFLKSMAPSIAPDQSFIIVAVRDGGPGQENLAISHKTPEGWSDPVHLPKPINSGYRESSPNLSADGKILTFTSNRVDYASISWPREKTITTSAEANAELQQQWQNGLRNIFQVTLNHDLLTPKKD